MSKKARNAAESKRTSATDRRLLYALSHELESFREKVALARAIQGYGDPGSSRNPVLNFAFSQCVPHVIESILLRFFEALPLLDKAAREVLSRPVVTAYVRGNPSCSVEEFETAVTLRHQGVGHRVRLGEEGQKTVGSVIASYGSILNFLDALLDRTRELLEELDQAGLYGDYGEMEGATRTVHNMFTTSDVAALVQAGNDLTAEAENRK
jgi:hypothetical protein